MGLFNRNLQQCADKKSDKFWDLLTKRKLIKIGKFFEIENLRDVNCQDNEQLM